MIRHNCINWFLVNLLIFQLAILEVSGQQNYNIGANYDSKSVFKENFDNNDNRWITDNPWVSGKIEDGHYTLKCKSSQSTNGLSYQNINLDHNKDYEIEANLKIIKGTGGLILGMANNFDHYRIEIVNGTDIVVIRNIPSKGKITKLLNISARAIITPGSPVKVTVRKITTVFYLYINEILFKDFYDIVPQGNQIGFFAGVGSEISADYLNVSYLEKKASPIVAVNQTAAADSSARKTTAAAVNPQMVTEKKLSTSATGPVITWISPASEKTEVETFSVRVKAGIVSASLLKSVLVYVNGVSKGEWEWKLSDAEKGYYIVEKTISLNPGVNSIYLVATNGAGTSRSVLRYLTNPSASPPLITWQSPVSEVSLVNKDLITVEACINSPSGLSTVKILVNGEDQGSDNVFQPSGQDECGIRWQKSVVLKQGENSIYVMASNNAGSTTSESRIIRFYPASEEKRIALIIGNADYVNNVSLKNPVNDANLMEGTLRSLGFDVIKHLNSGLDTMQNSIRVFSRLLSGYNIALFYYAGHGLQVDGVNYLIPTDAQLKRKEDCKWEAVDVTMVTDEFRKHSTNTNIIILDACRNNPYRSWARGSETGFKALGPINGTIISFATSEGATAADGVGANGLFTEELVKEMVIPQPIESVFKKTRKQVIDRSNGQQTPTEWSYLTGDFYFKK
jgi:hypothetical protein